MRKAWTWIIRDLVARVRRVRTQPKYVSVTIKDELSPADLAFVDSHHDFFPEMVLIQTPRRLYPKNGTLAHVIGYTGEISEQELDAPEFAKYNQGDVVGKFGIEKQYNDTLMGVDGQRQVVVDNRGQVRQTLAIKKAVEGKNLQLTIDLDLQTVAELAMDGKNGSVVALDPRSGEVLAMVSRPTFDPNKFAVRIKTKDWREIADNPEHPMLNRAIQAEQAPGSTFKPIVALAGLETGTIDEQLERALLRRRRALRQIPAMLVETGTRHAIPSRRHRPFLRRLLLHPGRQAGDRQPIAFYGDLVGFGQPTGIDLPHEKSGLMPSEKWKLRNYRTKWYAGETPSVAIGQGALIVTPLQLARAIGGIAVGGKWYQPHMVKKDVSQVKVSEWTLNPEHVKDVIDGMYGVVNEGGTGVRAALPHLEVCGKTGTAQLASNDFIKAGNLGKSMKDNAWFVGFAPRTNPEIVVVALFEHGEHGQFAAAIVRDVIKAYFDKKERLTLLQQNQTEDAGVLWRLGSTGSGWAKMTRYLSPRDIDWTVLLIVLLICGVGVLQIYSATRDTDYTSPGGNRSFTWSAGCF